MPTTKKRINISVSKEVEEAIALLSKRDEMPEATKAGELLRIALEIEEDDVLSSIVKNRDTKKSKFISHNEAWA